jgi:hypothetical protein
MTKYQNVLTATITEDGILYKIVLERQRDGIFKETKCLPMNIYELNKNMGMDRISLRQRDI